MKKILFIIPYIPYPLVSGGNQAFFHMTESIRQHMSVSILLFPQSSKDIDNVKNLKQIWNNIEFFIFKEKPEQLNVRHPFYYNILKSIKDSATRKMRRQVIQETNLVRKKSTLPSSIFKPFPSSYTDYVFEVSHRGFDIIQVEFYELISLGYLLPNDAETIFVHHELRYIHNANEMILFDKVTNEEQMMFHIAKDFERSALQSYKHIIALTEIDKNILADFIGRNERVYASPAVIQMKASNQRQFIPATTGRLTFVGSEDHCPNLDAVNWFCSEIAPILREQNFSFTLQVIGCWHSKYIKKLQKLCPEMELSGYVEDLHSFLQGSISLVPIRIGSGMRMKILDAVTAKVPFITTEKGVEGIDFHHKKECLVANTSHNFATAIIQLAKDTKLQEQMTAEAISTLQNLYQPERMLSRRLEIYKQILSEE